MHTNVRKTRQRPLRVATTIAVVASFMLFGTTALADGTEALGAPSIAIADGSGFAVGGTGLADQPGTIDVAVPAGATINQVLVYWEGMNTTAGGDDDIVLDGNTVTGTLIGGPTLFFGTGNAAHWSTSWRADITGLGLVAAGANSISASGLEFDQNNDGAGILVIYDDGTEADLGLVDGLDLAFRDFDAPLDTTVAQTFTFAAEAADRVADLSMFFSSVAGQDFPGDRPTVIEVTSGGTTTQHNDLLFSSDGEEWDTLVLAANVPAGATSVTVQALSADGSASGNRPASFSWTAAGLSVPVTPPPPPGGGEGCTPGYWKQAHHFDSWVGYAPTDSYEAVFGVDASFDLDLLGALRQGGGKEKALGRHAVAALLNTATAGVDYAYTTAEVIAVVQDAYATGDFNAAKDLLAGENEMGCPLS